MSKKTLGSKIGRLALWLSIFIPASCDDTQEKTMPRSQPPSGGSPVADDDQAYTAARQNMLTKHLAGRDIRMDSVLKAMGNVPRHKFVPEAARASAYQDSPLPIGSGQTISQPYIVALMTQLVQPKPHHKALDVGTGSGYQAAVLSELVDEVFSIEIVESLADQSRDRLANLGYNNVTVRHGDGYAGWPDEAPFDVIIVAAAPKQIPPALIEQLAPGGKLVIPVGDWAQTLTLVEKKQDGSVSRTNVAPVAFVPMTGQAQQKQ